jgi:hypothetical protein
MSRMRAKKRIKQKQPQHLHPANSRPDLVELR